ncbi:MAG: alpha/beta hydrolase [Microscillaceae bacterium]|nr:alpha/beta hydrolase [Microscillaceae bacterium]MDW8461594.1 hypothetical protein [Cytophagales bacterium]
MLCFHGFGQTPTDFLPVLSPYLQEYTFYCIDLTALNRYLLEIGERSLPLPVWEMQLNLFLSQESINHFEILGYSLGARLALATFHLFTSQVKGVWLVAPEGLYFNSTFFFATRTLLGRFLFRWLVMERYEILQNVIKLCQKFRFLSTSTARFFLKQITTPVKRKLIYDTWLFYAYCMPNISELRQKIRTFTQSFTIILGTEDRLISTKKIKNFAKTLPILSIKELPYSHQEIFLRFQLKK